MTGKARGILLAVVALVVLVVVVIAAIPMFLNTASFKEKIESAASKSLGRQVAITNLKLSVFSGGMLAQGVTISDDPSFSSQPFLAADSVKVHVALWPLITRRDVQVEGFVLETPKVVLMRNAAGIWNYSSIGHAAGKPAAQDRETQSAFPNLTVAEVKIENGQVTVTTQPMAGTTATASSHVYEQVDLLLTDFGFTKAFPFTTSVHLPGEGTVSVKGSAGPMNQTDAANTPFSAHLEAKHIDPLAAGFVDASSGISGQLDSLTLDAAWSGQQLHVTKLLIDGPHVTVVQKPKAPQAAAPAKAPQDGSMLTSLTVDDFQLTNGSVTVTSPGQQQPAVYQNVQAKLTNFSPTTASPFSASAQLPGGGSVKADGTAGPFNATNNAATPVNAQVALRHINLATSGLVAPDAGIGGMADVDAKLVSNGEVLNATGSGNIAGIQLAKTGVPSRAPVGLQFAVAQNERALTGQIQRAVVTIGHDIINIAGTYQTSGPTTAVDLKVNGQGMSVNDLEAFLPSVGVKLPSGSRLQGGTLTVNLTVSGSTANPVISGPVSLNNTVLAGFDLSSKLSGVTRLLGGGQGSSASSGGTPIRSLSMDIRSQGNSVRTDKIAVDVPSLGTASGAGSVNNSALDYHVVLKPTALGKGLGSLGGGAVSGAAGGGVAGQLLGMIPGGATKGLGSLAGGSGLLRSGIPVAIGGTTSSPTFTPDMRGLVGGVGASAAQGLLSGKGNKSKSAPAANPLGNALGGLLGGHH